MKKIKWSEELTLGVTQIDDQHRELLKITNGLINAIVIGRSSTTISNVVKKLREYTVFHFNSEEEFMSRIGYDKLSKHSTEHSNLKKKVKDFQRSIYKGEDIEPEELLELLKEWLLKHILESDRDIAVFIKREKISPKNLMERLGSLP